MRVANFRQRKTAKVARYPEGTKRDGYVEYIIGDNT